MRVEDRCRHEIRELHQFFEDWFNGSIDRSAEAFGRFESVMNDDFALIGRDGSVTDVDALATQIWDGWGHRADDEAPFRIGCEQFRYHRGDSGLHVASYVERQRAGTEENRRRSSALFRDVDGLPNDLEWLHVHESPIED